MLAGWLLVLALALPAGVIFSSITDGGLPDPPRRNRSTHRSSPGNTQERR
jgi:hypothetical protein